MKVPLSSRPGSGSVRLAPVVSDVVCVLAVYGCALAVARSLLMVESPQLVGTAVFLDLVVSTAACHWVLGVRLGGLPAWTVIPLAGAGLTLSQVMLPGSVLERGLLPLALAALVEGAAFVLVAARVRTVAAGFRAERQRGADVFCALEAGLLALGAYAAPLARWARLELELWFFALCGWLWRPRVPVGAAAFSHHREVGWSAIAAVLTTLVFVEGGLLHLCLESGGFLLVKWLVLASHVYALIWLLGDAQALRLRRTLLHPGVDACLDVRVGVRARARLELSQIADVRAGSWDSAQPGEQLLSVTGPANLRISFRQEAQLSRSLRAPAPMSALLLQVDEPGRLAAALSERVQRSR